MHNLTTSKIRKLTGNCSFLNLNSSGLQVMQILSAMHTQT